MTLQELTVRMLYLVGAAASLGTGIVSLGFFAACMVHLVRG